MVNGALAGKVDLIVTKSVSHFARNTLDSLSTIRKLKEHGTEVYFEKENIWKVCIIYLYIAICIANLKADNL